MQAIAAATSAYAGPLNCGTGLTPQPLPVAVPLPDNSPWPSTTLTPQAFSSSAGNHYVAGQSSKQLGVPPVIAAAAIAGFPPGATQQPLPDNYSHPLPDMHLALLPSRVSPAEEVEQSAHTEDGHLPKRVTAPNQASQQDGIPGLEDPLQNKMAAQLLCNNSEEHLLLAAASNSPSLITQLGASNPDEEAGEPGTVQPRTASPSQACTLPSSARLEEIRQASQRSPYVSALRCFTPRYPGWYILICQLRMIQRLQG